LDPDLYKDYGKRDKKTPKKFYFGFWLKHPTRSCFRVGRDVEIPANHRY
jgi:hypothetical protein